MSAEPAKTIEAPEGWSYPDPCPAPEAWRDGEPLWREGGVLSNRPPGAVVTDVDRYEPLARSLRRRMEERDG